MCNRIEKPTAQQLDDHQMVLLKGKLLLDLDSPAEYDSKPNTSRKLAPDYLFTRLLFQILKGSINHFSTSNDIYDLRATMKAVSFVNFPGIWIAQILKDEVSESTIIIVKSRVDG
jgi:hypothetical protein